MGSSDRARDGCRNGEFHDFLSAKRSLLARLRCIRVYSIQRRSSVSHSCAQADEKLA